MKLTFYPKSNKVIITDKKSKFVIPLKYINLVISYEDYV